MPTRPPTPEGFRPGGDDVEFISQQVSGGRNYSSDAVKIRSVEDAYDRSPNYPESD